MDASSMPPPRIVAVRLRSDALELVLDPSSVGLQAPDPFEMDTSGESWVLPRQRELLDRLQDDPEVVGAQAPLPSLVTLGRDERGLLLLDVEHAGSLAITGKEAQPLSQAMAIEMACSRWSDQVDLVVVGLEASVEELERVSRAPSVANVIERLERRVRERKALLDIVKRATNYETRWLEGGDAWDLCVVFCMEAAAKAEPVAVDELVRLAGEGSYGLAVVVCGTEVPSARTRVHVDGGPLSFEAGAAESPGDPGSVLWPQQVTPDFAHGVASLVQVASRTKGVSPLTPPYDDIASTPEAEHDGPEIEVRVIGPVEIVGAARPFTRAWAVELVVYLSMHRNGASTDQWATALWPDRVMAPASLHSTASAARRALGLARSGEDHLPRSHGRLALGDSVTTDWHRFTRYSRSEQPEDWRRALALVRGRPFEELRAPDWALLEGITATMEAVVVDLSCRFAESCLSSGDSAGAEWAARQGLRVSAYDERLYRILMRAADVAGNPAGVESVMAELAHLVNDEVEPFDAVHPETLELYRALSRRQLASRGR
jgi:DNA-binding SARP family transcriptional activator